MKKVVLFLSIITTVLFIVFFVVQGIAIKNEVTMPRNLQTIFGIVFLIVSIGIFVFLIFTILGKISVPAFIEVILFEIFIAAVVMGIVSLLLIFKQ